jgi:hypothetical protein
MCPIRFTLVFACSLLMFFACNQAEIASKEDYVIASGQMPNITKDKAGNIHMVYGTGDSIMYSTSLDGGRTFATPSLIAVQPGLAASHTRGPQIAASTNGLLVTACTNAGNIFSYIKEGSGDWLQTARVNDMDTVAKENLMALAADGNSAFAVWLDLRHQHNQVFGSRSLDGGKTWSKNIQVYASPDSTVCECCKPSVQVKGNNVYVMFRNWLQGSRDMYLMQSADGGTTFSVAQKLGKGTWKLNACPMDGGALAVSNDGAVQTVWRREATIYTNKAGDLEERLGEGKGCTLEMVDAQKVYAWVENGDVVIVKPQGQKQIVGKGNGPMLKAVDQEHVLCVWENNKQIHGTIIKL